MSSSLKIEIVNKLGFLFLILVVAVNLEAKELWIQAVGIDTKLASQNFEEHYYEGRSFAQLCKTKPSRQCEQFVNLDPKLAASEGGAFALSQIVQGHTIKNLNGPTKTEILARFEEALKNAGPGDKIIFSLVNHGGPSREEKMETGKSCISIDGDDCISELDLANIIKRHPLPERANLGIVVSACYSGAFHDLMAENVCVASTSDQYFASNSDTSDLWTSAVVRKAKSFSELSNPLNSHQNRIRLSAQIKR